MYIFLKQILLAFICCVLNFSSIFSLAAMSDFVERGKFGAWQNCTEIILHFCRILEKTTLLYFVAQT